MTIAQKKRKVKKKARAQRKKATGVTNAKRGKKSQLRKKKKSTPIASNKRKKRPTRAQLEKKLLAAEKKIKRLSGGKTKRSEAAKKGWETRKRKRAEQAEKSIRESEVIEGIVFSNLTQEQIGFLQRPEVREQIHNLYIEKIPEFFLADGEEWVQQKEPSILRRLIYAEVEGTFDEVAHDIADEYGYEPNEIYSLWWGYKLQD